MSDLVPATEIEAIVGVPRRRTEHWGRANSDEEMVYILHSAACLARTDLRDCVYSLALDNGIDMGDWDGHEDQPVLLGLDVDGWLIPSGGDQ